MVNEKARIINVKTLSNLCMNRKGNNNLLLLQKYTKKIIHNTFFTIHNEGCARMLYKSHKAASRARHKAGLRRKLKLLACEALRHRQVQLCEKTMRPLFPLNSSLKW